MQTPEDAVVRGVGVPEPWITRFADYLLSPAGDLRGALSVEPGEPLTVTVATSEGKPVWRLERSAAGTELSLDDAMMRYVLARADVRRHATGMLVVPTLVALRNRGVLTSLTANPDGLTLDALAAPALGAAVEDHLGYLYGALLQMAMVGWLEARGRSRATRFRVTAAGRVVFDLVARHADVVDRAVRSIARSKSYYLSFRDPGTPGAHAAELRELVDHSLAGWRLSPGDDETGRAAATQLARFLDGLLVCPLLIALSTPILETVGSTVEEHGTSLLGSLAKGPMDRSAAEKPYVTALLDPALDLFEARGVVRRDGTRLALTDVGAAWYRNRGQAGIPGAYLRMYEVFEDILFADPDPFGLAEDRHCDRIINIWASSPVSTALASQLCEGMLRNLFDTLPLEAQPAGIADMGCGDAKSLLLMAEFIRTRTRRGAELERFPLVVLGADYNESSRMMARGSLAKLDGVPGVRAAVLFGDVGDPARYDKTIRELAIPRPGRAGETIGAGDLAHTMMFLAHNRILALHDPVEAGAIVARSLARSHKGRLARALDGCGAGRKLPDDPEALRALVIDQFTTSYAFSGRLVEPIVAAADFIAFLERWRPYLDHGLGMVELHIPRHGDLRPASSPGRWSGFDKSGAQLWGFHYPTNQYPLPWFEHVLTTVLADLVIVEVEANAGNAYFTAARQNSVTWLHNGRIHAAGRDG